VSRCRIDAELEQRRPLVEERRYSLKLMVPILFKESASAQKSNSATVNFWLENGSSDSFGETQTLSLTTKSLAAS
jgi:hypothetical protein